MDLKAGLKKLWHIFWKEDNLLSWILNVGVAFLVIRYLIYPGLGLAFATTHPVVAVVSESMEHDDEFDRWWQKNGRWYDERNITQEQFSEFSFVDGFNKGDIMVVRGKDPALIEVGDTMIFSANRPDPIIHRVVLKWQDDEQTYFFQTKGDNNFDSIAAANVRELEIHEDRVIGVAVFRVPWLGYVKLAFVEFLSWFGIHIL